MEKETILKLSRKENESKYDEYQISAIDLSNKISQLVGGVLCAILAFVGVFAFEARELTMGVCAVYFSMTSSSSIVKFVKMKRKSDLVWSIIEALVAIAALVVMFGWLV